MRWRREFETFLDIGAWRSPLLLPQGLVEAADFEPDEPAAAEEVRQILVETCRVSPVQATLKMGADVWARVPHTPVLRLGLLNLFDPCGGHFVDIRIFALGTALL